MKKIFLTLAFIAAAQLSFAQGKSNEAQQPVSEQMAQLQLAADLAKYGYDTYSASALIEAARILAAVPTHKLTPESFTHGEGEAGNKDSEVEFSVEQLLKDAREYADGNASLLALADEVKVDNGTSRGRVGGASKTVERVLAYSTDTYCIKFYAGETAEVFVSGDGDTDLDVYVYDANGNLITQDDDYTDDCYVAFIPYYTTAFTIKIVNRGDVYNQYTMWTN